MGAVVPRLSTYLSFLFLLLENQPSTHTFAAENRPAGQRQEKGLTSNPGFRF